MPIGRLPWIADLQEMVITHTNGYDIDISSLKNCAEILDWIAQVSHKTWISDKDLGVLVRLVDDILSLQPNYCSLGIDRGIQNPSRIIKDRRR